MNDEPEKPVSFETDIKPLFRQRDREPNKKAKAPHEQGLQQMGGTGLEPVTPSLSSWCSPN